MIGGSYRIRIAILIVMFLSPCLFGQGEGGAVARDEFSAVPAVRIVTLALLAGLAVYMLTVKRKALVSIFSSAAGCLVPSARALPDFFNRKYPGVWSVVCSPYITTLAFVLLAAFFFFHLWNGIAVRVTKLSQNHYVYLADAFLHGRFDIPLEFVDTVMKGDAIYSVFPPFPAVVLVPFVAFFGTNINMPLVSELVLIVSAVLLVRILHRLKVRVDHILWITIGYFWGTGYWLCLIGSDGVWHFAQLVAVMMLFFAIHETLGKGRGFLVGLFVGAAFLCRQLAICTVVFLVMPLVSKDGPISKKIANLMAMTVALGVAGAAYLGYNWARFGNPFDTGYAALRFADFHAERVSTYGLFHPSNIVFNAVYYFLQGFHVQFESFGKLVPTGLDPFGTSLLAASPFVVFSLWGKWKKGMRIACWISILGILAVHLLYFNNGWMQTHMQRFSLDFLPLLVMLVALGIKRFPAYIWKATIAVSVALNVFALLIVSL